MPWTAQSDPTGSWSAATDPTSADPWSGRCDTLDAVSKPPPGILPDFTSNDLAILEGFEMPQDYVQGTQDIFNGGSSSVFSIEEVSRGATLTGGKSLKVTLSSSVGGRIDFGTKVGNSTHSYYRAYVKIDSFTNTNLSIRDISLFGWTDSTGDRLQAALRFPAASGSTPIFALIHPLTLAVDTGPAISLNTWYRLELIGESLSGTRIQTTLYIYLDDTNTLVDTLSIGPVAAAGSGIPNGFPFISRGILSPGNALTYHIDDIRIHTRSPTPPTTAVAGPQYGAGGIWGVYPLADVAAVWTRSSGTDGSDLIDEFPLSTFDGDTSYISSLGTSALLDTYTFAYNPNTIPSDKLIKAVELRARLRVVSGSGGNPSIGLSYVGVDEDTTQIDGTARSILVTSYRNWSLYQQDTTISPSLFIVYTDGLNTGWKNEHLMGIRRVAGTAGTIRVTSIFGHIEVAP